MPQLENSTNVRPSKRAAAAPSPLAIRAARATFRVLSPHAPRLAARWAEHLFLRPRQFRRPDWERRALASARRDWLVVGKGKVPLWAWSPHTPTDKAAVLLVHGWEGRGSQLAAFVAPLLARGYPVVTFDGPGHGDSNLPYGSVVDQARTIVKIAQRMPLHAVIGHSVGGAATLFATRLGLDVARIALLAPPVSPADFAKYFAKMLGIAPAIRDAMIARLEDRYETPWEELDATLDAARLTKPLLVVHDTDDRFVPFAAGKLLAETAPRGELVTTQGLGHHRILRTPELVDETVRFVDDGPFGDFARTLDGELFHRDTRWSRRA